MKNPLLSFLRRRNASSLALGHSSPIRFFLAHLLTLLVAGGPFCGPALKAAQNNDDFNIGVRSSVERRFTGLTKEAIREHGKLYAVIALDQSKDDNTMVKPMNEFALLAEVKHTLATRGFREPAAGTNPDIVLTILYGRSYLRNPYADKSIAGAGGADFGGAPIVTASSDQILRERETPGYEIKRRSANAEKLFISVTAWKFPTHPKEKPQKIWVTTVYTDDPDKDLNQLSAKMLAAGAAYFDHQIDEEEITVSSANAHVELGTPTVVEPAKTGGSK